MLILVTSLKKVGDTISAFTPVKNKVHQKMVTNGDKTVQVTKTPKK